MKIKPIITLCFILCINLINAQITIKGKVADMETNEALPFVTVISPKLQIGTTTDFEGFYELKLTKQTDTIVFLYLGYQTIKIPITNLAIQEINVSLTPSGNTINEIIVKPGVNKAHRIIRNAQDNKKQYNIQKIDKYEYESFTKIQIAVDNITEKFKKRKIFSAMSPLFDTISSLKADSSVPVLPVFQSEILSDYFFLKSPYRTKEIIKATRVRGVGISEDSYVSQVLGSSFQQYNFNVNNVYLFDKDFISPISNLSLNYYFYQLVDSFKMDGRKTYKILVRPKNTKDLVFTGTIWIQDSTFALKQLDLEITKSANINFIEKMKIQQEMTQVDNDIFIPSKTRVLIDVAEVTNNTLGMIATYYNSTKKHKLDMQHDLKFYDEKLKVLDDAETKNAYFWDTARHEKLTQADIKIATLIDSFRNQPLVKTYVDFAEMIAEGYKPYGPIEIGPYASIIGWNPLEGFRTKIGFITNEKFKKNSRYQAYIAYGFGDKKLKYGFENVYILSRKKWTKVAFGYKNDIDLLGVTDNPDITSSIFKSLSTIGATRLNRTIEYRGFLETELYKGIVNKFYFKHCDYTFTPIQDFNFQYYKDMERGIISPQFSISTATFETKISLKQQIVVDHVDRLNFGNLKQPVITISYTKGFKALGGQFEFDKIGLKIWQYTSIGNFGNIDYTIQASKTFGVLPFPILEVARGNPSVISSNTAYNLMNFFEFVSDQNIAFRIEHNDNGLLFNRIPKIRKLNLRAVVNFKGIYGTISDGNLALIPKFDHTGLAVSQIGVFQKNKPYFEFGYGIENFFKFIRLDFIHRINYLDNADIKPFGVKCTFVFKF